MFFWRKERQIVQAIEEYLQETENCLSSFVEAFDVFLTDGLGEKFEQLVEQTHRAEQASDARRREIEAEMYGKALIPESRGDVLAMLEALDLIPNKCESTLYLIWTQSMRVPEPFRADLRELVAVNRHAYTELTRTMRALFTKAALVGDGANRVADMESRSDALERKLIKAVFDADLDTAEKILLKELVLEVGSISDRAENAADRLRIIAVKRQT